MFTHIEIAIFCGARSLPAKRALYQAIVRRIEPFGVRPDDVKIILREIMLERTAARPRLIWSLAIRSIFS
jgi:Tautomerase enzyme